MRLLLVRSSAMQAQEVALRAEEGFNFYPAAASARIKLTQHYRQLVSGPSIVAADRTLGGFGHAVQYCCPRSAVP
jgi:hypothetical protein